MTKKIKLEMELSENQFQLLLNSLEEYFRFRMCQANTVANMLADDTFKYDKNDPNNDKKFNDYIERREHLRYVLQAVVGIAYGSFVSESSDDCRNVSDMWSVIRHAEYENIPNENKSDWDVRSREPIQLGSEEIPKVSVKYVE